MIYIPEKRKETLSSLPFTIVRKSILSPHRCFKRREIWCLWSVFILLNGSPHIFSLLLLTKHPKDLFVAEHVSIFEPAALANASKNRCDILKLNKELKVETKQNKKKPNWFNLQVFFSIFLPRFISIACFNANVVMVLRLKWSKFGV